MAEKVCAVDGCEKGVLARGWCTMHYNRWKKHGDPLTVLPSGRPFTEGRRTNPENCTEDGCDRAAVAKGLCQRHWKVAHRNENGDAVRAKEREYNASHPGVRKDIAKRYAESHPEHNAEKSKHRRELHPDENERYRRAYQEASLEAAVRYRHEWAGWELERVLDTSVTVREHAAALGRTVASVARMRHQARYDPKTIARVGISDSGRL